jgi:hypothetical protein
MHSDGEAAIVTHLAVGCFCSLGKVRSTRVGSYSICCRPRGGGLLDSPAADFKKTLYRVLRLIGCDTAAVRVTCLMALAYEAGSNRCPS